jgi:FtsP/CotA-like multicopper oxidase with cupredoxin domain
MTEHGSIDGAGRRVLRLLALAVQLSFSATQAWAQSSVKPPYVDCPPNIDLKTDKLSEIVSQGGVLAGTVVLADEERAQALATGQCLPQIRRFYQNTENTKPMDINVVHRPVPGPTLRGKVGDVVNLTFLNQIDPLDFNQSVTDQLYKATGDLALPGVGCDSSGPPINYPNVGNDPKTGKPTIDSLPNCFHGSSTGNIHFHGTHTNPNATGDNVFIGVRPSPRLNGMPTVTGASVLKDFTAFFQNCNHKLQTNSANQWPAKWGDDPDILHWATGPDGPGFVSQETMLKAFDASLPPVTQQPDPRALWPVDDRQNTAGQWPQYYVGAFPYCFVLPNWPGTGQAAKQFMGQAPGTHWYHAHKHGSTALNVSNGMTGAFIVEGASYDGMLNAFFNQYRTTDKTTDWTRQQLTMVVNQLGGTPNLESGGGGKADLSINGQITPDATMYAGEVQMWRIVNTSSISGFYLPELPTGFTWRQIAQDGVQFPNDNYQASGSHDKWSQPIFLAAGNRVDLLVRACTVPDSPQTPSVCPAIGSNSAVNVVQAVSVSRAQTLGKGAKRISLLNIKVRARVATGPSAEPVMRMLPKMGPRPDFLKDIGDNVISNRIPRDLKFHTENVAGPSEHKIDGFKFGEGPPWVIDKIGVAEEWKIINSTPTTNNAIDHPFHIHINPFQVTAVFDPNEPLTDTAHHAVFDTTNPAKPVVVPRYYIVSGPSANKTWLNNQCALDPANPATLVPCAKPLVQMPNGPPQPPIVSTNIWWDVFPIPAAGTFKPTAQPGQPAPAPIIIPGYFKLRSWFVDYFGNYVIHCHILAHEDRGMMVEVQAAPSMWKTAGSMPMQHH